MKQLNTLIQAFRFYFLQNVNLLFCTFIVSSCSGNVDELFPKEKLPMSSKQEIRLSTKVTTVRSEYVGSQIAKGNKVGIFIAENITTAPMNYPENIVYEADGEGNLTTAKAQYFPQSGNSINISAYHPYTGSVNDIYTFQVKTDQSSVSNLYESDLLYAPVKTQAPSDQPVSLTFKHLLTKVDVELTAANSTTDLKGTEISMINVVTGVQFNRKTGELGDVSTDLKEINLGNVKSVIIPPQTIKAGTRLFKIKLVNNKVLYYTQKEDVVLGSQKNSTFKLKVNLSDIGMIRYEVDNWQEGSVIEGPVEPSGKKYYLPVKIDIQKDNAKYMLLEFKYDSLRRIISKKGDFEFNDVKVDYLSKSSNLPIKEVERSQVLYKNYTYKNDSVFIQCKKNYEFEYNYIIPNKEGYITKRGDIKANEANSENETGIYDYKSNVLKRRTVYIDYYYKPDLIRYTGVSDYEYDDKKNIFADVNVPKWFLKELPITGAASYLDYIVVGDHNPIKVRYNSSNIIVSTGEHFPYGILSNSPKTSNIEYIYNEDGYPISYNVTFKSDNLETIFHGFNAIIEYEVVYE